MNYLMGQGRVLIGKRGTSGRAERFRHLGNCTQLQVSLGIAAQRYTDKTSDMLRTGSKPSISLTLESFHPDNMALLMQGASYTTPTTRLAFQSVVYRGESVLLPDINIAVVHGFKVIGNSTVYREGVDYVLHRGSGDLEIPANSRIADGATVEVEYSHNQYRTVGAFNGNQDEYWLRFAGTNMADGLPVVLDVFRIAFDPVDVVSLIGDNLSNLQVTGRVMQDDSLTLTSAESRFLRIIT